MIRPVPRVAALAAYALADLRVAPGKPVISLAQNESMSPPSPRAIAAAHDALASAHLYPDPDWHELGAAIAAVHGVPAEGILCGSGSMELIGTLIAAFAGPGDQVVAGPHAYAFFRTAAQAAAADYVAAGPPALTVSVDGILGAVTERTRIVCLDNPGNPTGTRISGREVRRLRDALPGSVLLLIDEAYGEYADHLGEPTFDLVERGDSVVLRTFSKAYGLAGLRIGWGLFPPAIGDEVRKLLSANNINVASQAAAAAAMGDQATMRAVVSETALRRDRFAERVRALGLDVGPSFTNFVLIGFADAAAAQRADRALRAEGVVLRGMAGYGLPHALRATIGTEVHMTLTTQVLSMWRRSEDSR